MNVDFIGILHEEIRRLEIQEGNHLRLANEAKQRREQLIVMLYQEKTRSTTDADGGDFKPFINDSTSNEETSIASDDRPVDAIEQEAKQRVAEVPKSALPGETPGIYDGRSVERYPKVYPLGLLQETQASPKQDPPSFMPTELVDISQTIKKIIDRQELNRFSSEYISHCLQLDRETVIKALEFQENKLWKRVGESDLHWESIQQPTLPSTNIQIAPNSNQRYKHWLPKHNLVENTNSLRDLLNNVFVRNQDGAMRCNDILEYLYGDEMNNWSAENKKRYIKIISQALTAYLKRGNWTRIVTGLYKYKDKDVH